MGINPLKLMQLKDAWMQFNRRHPKLADAPELFEYDRP